MNKYIKFVGTLVIALSLIILGFLIGRTYENNELSSAKKTGKDFTSLVLAGDLTKAYDMGSKNFKSTVSLKEFNNSFNDAKTNKPTYLQEAIVDSGEIVTAGFILDGLQKNADESTKGLFTVTLIKESGKWRVESAILN
jgi:hypothetical protein